MEITIAQEKLILALVFAAKRLRRYFQAHPIVVITDQPIKQVISKPDASGRLQKWSVLLGGRHTSLIDHYASERTDTGEISHRKTRTDVVTPQSEVILQEPWILFTDGSSWWTATNNEAEYEALIAELRIAARMGVRVGRYLENNPSRRWEYIGDRRAGSYVDDPYHRIHKARARSLMNKRMPGEYAARRRDSNFEMVSSIDVRSYNHGSDASDLFRQTMCSARFMRVHAYIEIPRQPQQELTPITSPWPFHKWGIDIAGPFPVAAGGLKFLIVAIDYFTKWIEAKAVATITGNQERREQAAIREEKAKLQMKGYYDAKVRGVSFKIRRFVYVSNDRKARGRPQES
ncbi:reverse transcriptase domain-containing protein [Tanacetum coccineum]